MTKLKEWALKYADNGFKIFPLKEKSKKPLYNGGFKIATDDKAIITKWWNEHPNANIGLATGDINNLFVVDIDTKNNHDGVQALNDMNINLSPTLMANTPSGGIHMIYKTEEDYSSKANLLDGIDIRANGGYIVVAPSVYNETNQSYSEEEKKALSGSYQWIGTFSKFAIVDFDNNCKKLLDTEQNKKWADDFFTGVKKFNLPNEIIEGERNTILFKYACSLQAKGIDDKKIFELVNDKAKNACNPPILGQEFEELQKTITGVLKRYEKGNPVDKPTKQDGSLNLDYFHHVKYNKNLDKKVTGVYKSRIKDYIVNNFNIVVVNNKPWIYKNGVYTLDENNLKLKNIIQKYMYPEFIEPKNINPICELILMEYKIQKETTDLNKSNKEWINFKNGMYDVKNKKLYEHDPKYLSINQIPHNIESKYVEYGLKDAPVFHKFLTTTLENEDDRTMLLQYMAYCLTRETKVQKAMSLLGPGGVGKSVIIRLLEKITGLNNISHLSLQALEERFTTQILLGKLINIYADNPAKAMGVISTFKMITGQDEIRGEYKGGAIFSFKPYVKLFFSSNELPKNLDENSNAYYRRLLIVKFKGKGEYIDNLEEKLGKEIPIILGILMNYLHDVICSNWFILESEQSKFEIEKLRMETDSFIDFDKECIKEEKGKRVKPNKLYSYYQSYCYEYGRKPIGKRKFYSRMEELGYIKGFIEGYQYYKNIIAIKYEDYHELIDNGLDLFY